ncbi:MAG: hypothetical protein KME18_02740 [Phormidium tanganyikae FI6-MK23]|jgi:hypothetical protein|nr:hypothetical protein [Phormidium tanganyikae FI6-MK23]
MPSLKSQWVIRRKQIPSMLLLSVIGAIPLSFAIAWFSHDVKVWQNDGVWCANFYSDGRREIVYGSACSRQGDSQV